MATLVEFNIVAMLRSVADKNYISPRKTRRAQKIQNSKTGFYFFFADFTTRLLRYVLRTVLVYVQNAPGILVRSLRLRFSLYTE